MKKIIATLLCAVVLLSASLVSVSAITKSDTPIVGGNTIFTVKEFIYEGEPTATSPWSNAFCNEDWTGCRWSPVVEDGIDCIAVETVQGWEHYMDFNWYQWNNDKYYPALDCSEYKFFKVKYKLNDVAAEALAEITEGASQFVAKTQDILSSGSGASGTLRYTMTVASNEWIELIIPLSDTKFSSIPFDIPWEEETIRQFRYYPFGSIKDPIKGGICYIEYMAFFKTEAEAKAFTNAAPEDPEDPEVPEPPKTADHVLVSVIAAFVSFGVATSVVIAKKRAK